MDFFDLNIGKSSRKCSGEENLVHSHEARGTYGKGDPFRSESLAAFHGASNPHAFPADNVRGIPSQPSRLCAPRRRGAGCALGVYCTDRWGGVKKNIQIRENCLHASRSSARYKNVATLKQREFRARMRLVERLESPL